MSRHERFSLRSAEDLARKAGALGLDLPYQSSIDPLFRPHRLADKLLPNRLTVHPMEGFDGLPDGSPGELTFRRYGRYAAGGSGLIWFEATSVVPEGRSNPCQLMLHAGNLATFRRLVDHIRETARHAFGREHNPFLVLQLTHSGRYSRPAGEPLPQVAAPNAILDRGREAGRVLSDEELARLEDRFVDVALLARDAGFDAVDIKACHGYLLHELLSSFERHTSRFGGVELEDRLRFLTEVIETIRRQAPELAVGCRLNLFDGLPHPQGFGVVRGSTLAIDWCEPIDVVRRLALQGCTLINVTMGIPYCNPHLGRPFDRPLPGAERPLEHPLEGVARLIAAASKLQREFPDLTVVGTGYSWLRQFFPQVAAAVLDRGDATLIGLGRSSFAYPDAPKDLSETGRLDPGKVCVACSGCTQLMRKGGPTGCVVRDREVYQLAQSDRKSSGHK